MLTIIFRSILSACLCVAGVGLLALFMVDAQWAKGILSAAFCWILSGLIEPAEEDNQAARRYLSKEE